MENDDEQLSMVVTSVSDGSIVGIYGGRNQMVFKNLIVQPQNHTSQVLLLSLF